jgi:Calx-beta domain-containing protein
MRFQPAHAAPRDSAPPPKRRVPRPLRTALSVAVAATFGLVQAVMVSSPAQAAPADFLTIADAGNWEGNVITFTATYTGTSAAGFHFETVDTGSAVAAVDYSELATSAYDATPAARPVADGDLSTTAGLGITSAGDAQFTAADIGSTVIGSNITGTATIASVTSTTVATLAAGATVTGAGANTGVTITKTRPYIVFPASTASVPSTATVTVATIYNPAVNAVDKNFILRATPVAPATGPPRSATGTIWQSTDGAASPGPMALPTFTLMAPSMVPEAQPSVTVTATLSRPMPHDVTIPVETVAGTATSNNGVNRDFTALASDAVIVVQAYQLSGTTTVGIWDDSVYEGVTQYFTVDSPASTAVGANGSSAPSTANIGIVDNDAAPTVSIGDAPAVTEGGSLVFPITLSALSENSVAVLFSTADGTDTTTSHGANAVSGDYAPASSAVATILPYNKSVNRLVVTNPDGILEGTETVKATIASSGGSVLGTPITATGTITDGSTLPTLGLDTNVPTFGPMEFDEGPVGEAVKSITVTTTITGTLQVPLQVNYSFVDVTATNGLDYKGSPGSFTIPAGTASGVTRTIPVTIIGDRIFEPSDETFNVVFTSPNGTIDSGSLGAKTFTIVEANGGTPPTWTTGDVSVSEGDSGTTMARVPIRLSVPAGADVTFTTDLSGVASATESGVSSGITVGDDDFNLPTVKTVTIPAGSLTGYLDVPINGDVIFEHNELLSVLFAESSPYVTLGAAPDSTDTAWVTIINDDAAPTVTFNQAAGTEGSTIRVSATTAGLSQYPYTLGFAVAPIGANPATAGTDYEVSTNPLLSFSVARGAQGPLSRGTPATTTIAEVYLSPDDIDEATETFGVTATEITPSPAGIATTTGTYRISDDPADLPPTASVSDESIKEGEASVDVPVTLAFTGDTTSSTQPFTASYYTVDGTAVAGQDYTETRGTLTIPAGTMTYTINVPITNDKLVESDENFFVKIGTPGPAGATLGKYASEVIIHSDDIGSGEPAPTISAPASINGPGSVMITGSATTAGTWVELWGAPFGSPLANIVGISAKAGGAYAFSKYLPAGYKFQVKANGKSSAVKEVWVKALLSLSTSAGRGTIGMSATGNPKTVNTMVSFQIQNSRGTWVTLGSDKTGPTGNATAVLKKLKSGSKFSCRAVIAGTPSMGISSGTSAVKVVTVR